VHQAVEESACGDDDALGIELCAPDGAYADSLAIVHEQFVGLVLPDVEVVGVIEDGSPLPDKLSTVALGTGTPYSRTLADVEHSELDGSLVGYDAHLATERIDLSYDLPLGDAADSRVATHLANLVHVHRYQAGLGTHVGRGCGSLASGVTATDNEYVIIESHKMISYFKTISYSILSIFISSFS